MIQLFTPTQVLPAPEPATPIITIIAPLPPSTNFIPSRYELHLHSQLCINCGHGSEWTCAYAYDPTITRGSHLRAVSRFSYDIPVITVRPPVQTVPACQECHNRLSLSHLEKPLSANPNTAIMAAFQTAQAKPVPQPVRVAARPSGTTPKAKKTLDDFLS